MAELNPATLAAFQSPRPLIFGAAELLLAAGPVRLLDGSYELMVGGNLYTGRDPSWGVLDTIKGLTDTTGNQAPSVTLGMIPESDLALATMVDPSLQGSPVTIMVGAVHPATGLLIGEVYVCLTGELDVPTISWDNNDRRVEFKVTTVAERLFMTEEGRRLASAFHQRVWPGEKGLDYVTGVEITVPWGQALDTTAVSTRSNLPSYTSTTART
jgi:hypothetical protein